MVGRALALGLFLVACGNRDQVGSGGTEAAHTPSATGDRPGGRGVGPEAQADGGTHSDTLSRLPEGGAPLPGPRDAGQTAEPGALLPGVDAAASVRSDAARPVPGPDGSSEPGFPEDGPGLDNPTCGAPKLHRTPCGPPEVGCDVRVREELDLPIGHQTSIAVDDEGVVHLLHATEGGIYVRGGAGAWTQTAVSRDKIHAPPQAPPFAVAASLTLDGDGRPSGLIHLRWSPSFTEPLVWEMDTLASTGGSLAAHIYEPDALRAAGGCLHAAVDLGPSARPVSSTMPDTSAADPGYAVFDGRWQTVALQPDGVAAPHRPAVVRRPAITIGPDGAAQLAFFGEPGLMWAVPGRDPEVIAEAAEGVPPRLVAMEGPAGGSPGDRGGDPGADTYVMYVPRDGTPEFEGVARLMVATRQAGTWHHAALWEGTSEVTMGTCPPAVGERCEWTMTEAEPVAALPGSDGFPRFVFRVHSRRKRIRHICPRYTDDCLDPGGTCPEPPCRLEAGVTQLLRTELHLGWLDDRGLHNVSLGYGGYREIMVAAGPDGSLHLVGGGSIGPVYVRIGP